MFAKPEKVRARRIRRQLKAVASIGVALAAGAFLACRREPTREPGGAPAASSIPRTDDTNAPASASTSANASARTPGSAGSAAAPGSASANANANASAGAGATTTALASTRPAPVPVPTPTVDKNQHKKGMPVPDNLIE